MSFLDFNKWSTNQKALASTVACWMPTVPTAIGLGVAVHPGFLAILTIPFITGGLVKYCLDRQAATAELTSVTVHSPLVPPTSASNAQPPRI